MNRDDTFKVDDLDVHPVTNSLVPTPSKPQQSPWTQEDVARLAVDQLTAGDNPLAQIYRNALLHEVTALCMAAQEEVEQEQAAAKAEAENKAELARRLAEAKKNRQAALQYADGHLWNLVLEPRLVLSKQLQRSGARVECFGQQLPVAREIFRQKQWARLVRLCHELQGYGGSEQVAKNDAPTTIGEVDEVRQQISSSLKLYVRLFTNLPYETNTFQILAFADSVEEQNLANSDALVDYDYTLPQPWERFPDGGSYLQPYAPGTREILLLVTPRSDTSLTSTATGSNVQRDLYQLRQRFHDEAEKLAQKQKYAVVDSAAAFRELRQLREKYIREIESFGSRY
jgi:hypothetical protein